MNTLTKTSGYNRSFDFIFLHFILLLLFTFREHMLHFANGIHFSIENRIERKNYMKNVNNIWIKINAPKSMSTDTS